MRRRYKRVYKEELARLKADRDFQVREEKRQARREKKKERQVRWIKKLKKSLFSYKR